MKNTAWKIMAFLTFASLVAAIILGYQLSNTPDFSDGVIYGVSVEQTKQAQYQANTQQVQFENPILPLEFPTAQQLEGYSTVPAVTPVFAVGQFQPNYLTQSVPTMQITPPVDSAYSFCGREGKDIVFAETSGNKRIEITYIGQFYEIPTVLTGSYKQVSTTGNFDEQIIGVIAPNNAIELPNGTFTNWQVVAVYCMAPYQTQALEYIQGGIYRVMANNVYAYYQAIGYSVSYIDNETGRSLDPSAPPSSEMVQWPIPGVTIVP